MFYLYILYSSKADLYYVGYTDDIARRMVEHNISSEGKFTSKYRPWELKASFDVGMNRGVAMKIERHIKKQRSRSYIEAILERKSIDILIKRFSSRG